MSDSMNFKRTKLACYTAYFTMSSVFCLSPLLFATFHNTYGVSYTLLGTLVLVNFCTQLTIDLIFSFFSKLFNIAKTVRVMPIITSVGMVLYALSPVIMPNNVYIGLVLGTVLFSVSAGLSEVLLSPMIAAIPSKDPQRDMSFLHSLYAFGVVTTVVLSTLFFKVFGTENWPYLMGFFAVLPLAASVMFFLSPIPEMSDSGENKSGKSAAKKNVGLMLCVLCIFFGSCAENTMSNWISSYVEKALSIDKAVGDILGMAVFAGLLGMGRFTYSRFGKNINRVLLFSMLGAALCYITAALSNGVVAAFVACALTGIFVAMLWPGTLIMMEENLPGMGVAAYALMAAGGDLGASIAPQLMGIVVDNVSESAFAVDMGAQLNMLPEQIGLKSGMLVSAVFPIATAVLLILTLRYFKKQK